MKILQREIEVSNCLEEEQGVLARTCARLELALESQSCQLEKEKQRKEDLKAELHQMEQEMNAASEASLKSRTKLKMFEKNKNALQERIKNLFTERQRCVKASTKYSKVLQDLLNTEGLHMNIAKINQKISDMRLSDDIEMLEALRSSRNKPIIRQNSRNKSMDLNDTQESESPYLLLNVNTFQDAANRLEGIDTVNLGDSSSSGYPATPPPPPRRPFYHHS
eukprot:g10.t1